MNSSHGVMGNKAAGSRNSVEVRGRHDHDPCLNNIRL